MTNNCFYRELFIYHSGSRKQQFLRDTLKQFFTENQHRQVHCHLISTRLSTCASARVRCKNYLGPLWWSFTTLAYCYSSRWSQKKKWPHRLLVVGREGERKRAI